MSTPANGRDRRDEHWIFTWSGRRFWPLDPRAEDISIEDIAGALSQQCRFGGHSRRFYSVAQHCVHVAELLEHEGERAMLAGLLHDAPEAYLVDLPRPLKLSAELALYRRAEARIMAAVVMAFDLPERPPRALAWADEVLLATEVRDLMHPKVAKQWRLSVPPLASPIEPWDPDLARERFLALFGELCRYDGTTRRTPAHGTASTDLHPIGW